MSDEVLVLLYWGFLAFFMGGYVFTYFAVMWFENEIKEEEKSSKKVINLPAHPIGKSDRPEEIKYKEDKKIA
jgi:hypothetical protein